MIEETGRSLIEHGGAERVDEKGLDSVKPRKIVGGRF